MLLPKTFPNYLTLFNSRNTILDLLKPNIYFRSDKPPPFKKEKSEEKEKDVPKTPASIKPKASVKSEKLTPKSKSPKKSPKSTEKLSAKKSPAKKSPTMKPPAKKSPNDKNVSALFKKETPAKSTEQDKSEIKSEPDAKNDDEIIDNKASPNNKDKPINPFFLGMKKELKVQSVGAGLKGADYSPDKLKYDPIKDAFWGHGEK